jgi:crossover junction endodeoxyribonuclease RusA
VSEVKAPVCLELPWPPTVNTYWRRVGPKTLISARGRAYRDRVREVRWVSDTAAWPLSGRLVVKIEAFPPNRRAHDLDNILKALLDALQHAGVYLDDAQIDRLEVQRRELGGFVTVTVEETT